jgi:hypothetical protein
MFGRTGGGQASGTGWRGGYGPIQRSAYATPAELGFKPWTPDYMHDDNGASLYPTGFFANPTSNPPLVWQTEDWDPGLRFWTLPFDPNLNEWLQDVDLSSPAIMVAREFAAAHANWSLAGKDPSTLAGALLGDGWLRSQDIEWTTGSNPWNSIKGELETLVDLMEDSRARYLNESLAQADAPLEYFIHFLGLDYERKWWTIMLMRCGLTIGNIFYMHYKARFARVRPSTLCPGLVPPFGPPRHPSFPSGHSFIGHFIALLLLEIPEVARRYGVGMSAGGTDGKKVTWAEYEIANDLHEKSALFWLAMRLGRNRERIGVHYPSDTTASRSMAGKTWNMIFGATKIAVPTLHKVLARAQAEWK